MASDDIPTEPLGKVHWLVKQLAWMLPLIALERFASHDNPTGFILVELEAFDLVVLTIWDKLGNSPYRRKIVPLSLITLVVAGISLLGGDADATYRLDREFEARGAVPWVMNDANRLGKPGSVHTIRRMFRGVPIEHFPVETYGLPGMRTTRVRVSLEGIVTRNRLA